MIRSKLFLRCLAGLVLLAMLLAALVGCGGPEPTPQIVVVTNTPTPEPQIVVVTATFTATPPPTDTPPPTETPVPPTDTPLPPPPTDTPLPEPTEATVSFVAYEHPSGAFGLDIPADADISEAEDNLVFFYGDSVFMAIFTQLDAAVGAADLEDMIPIIVDSALVGQGLIDSYENLETAQQEGGAGDGIVVAGRFDMTSGMFGDGEGGMILSEYGQTLYINVMVTPNYDAVREVWRTLFDTMWVVPPAVEAPQQAALPTAAPTNTPKPTAKPQPKPTNTSPPPAATKGCYLFQNHLNAAVTITFTARDWQWSDVLTLAAGAEKQYCLDPGRYTYTMDAPPPWGSTNGELTVVAGDNYLWPIQGR